MCEKACQYWAGTSLLGSLPSVKNFDLLKELLVPKDIVQNYLM